MTEAIHGIIEIMEFKSGTEVVGFDIPVALYEGALPNSPMFEANTMAKNMLSDTKIMNSFLVFMFLSMQVCSKKVIGMRFLPQNQGLASISVNILLPLFSIIH